MENLGYTPKQYKTTLKKLDQKHAGEKRLLQQYIETILQTSTIWELEIFSDRLVDVVAKLKYYGHQITHGSFKALHSHTAEDAEVTTHMCLLCLHSQ